MKTGRNETCPCGSGAKYKQCCLLKETDEKTGLRLVREIEAALMERMLPFAEEVFGDEAINEALLLFLDDEDEVEYEAEDPLNALFLPWYIYNWVIEAEEDKPSPEAPLNKTIAEAFLEAESHDISPEGIALIKASIRRPLSFYEVIESVPGKRLELKDLLQGPQMIVEEDAASTSLKRGEIVIGAMMQPLDGHIRASMLGPFSLPPECKAEILDLRGEILAETGLKDLDEPTLLNREAFVLGLYLDILDRMLDEDEVQVKVKMRTSVSASGKHRSPSKHRNHPPRK